jgi:hypothetical protein
VVLDLNLRFQIVDPVTLTQHYDDPLQAMVNPAQTAVNGVIRIFNKGRVSFIVSTVYASK